MVTYWHHIDGCTVGNEYHFKGDLAMLVEACFTVMVRKKMSFLSLLFSSRNL